MCVLCSGVCLNKLCIVPTLGMDDAFILTAPDGSFIDLATDASAPSPFIVRPGNTAQTALTCTIYWRKVTIGAPPAWFTQSWAFGNVPAAQIPTSLYYLQLIVTGQYLAVSSDGTPSLVTDASTASMCMKPQDWATIYAPAGKDPPPNYTVQLSVLPENALFILTTIPPKPPSPVPGLIIPMLLGYNITIYVPADASDPSSKQSAKVQPVYPLPQIGWGCWDHSPQVPSQCNCGTAVQRGMMMKPWTTVCPGGLAFGAVLMPQPTQKGDTHVTYRDPVLATASNVFTLTPKPVVCTISAPTSGTIPTIAGAQAEVDAKFKVVRQYVLLISAVLGLVVLCVFVFVVARALHLRSSFLLATRSSTPFAMG